MKVRRSGNIFSWYKAKPKPIGVHAISFIKSTSFFFADGLKDRKTKDEVDNEQSNTLIQLKNQSLSSKQESEEG